MRLLSAVVRNYRVHQEIAVDFDRSRTLIGGPNESGKSTLVEAIHRALFLKATVTGEAQASMVSTVHPGQPEVEICFEAQGGEYRLAKRFSGKSGTVLLAQTGGSTWQGEEAESRLAGLLGVVPVGGGKGVLDRVQKQWAHLWVWQGQSSGDVSEHVEGQRADLIKQLQQIGGAVALQSELDGWVASWFSQARNQIFTRVGVPKSGSDLDRAQSEAQRAEAAQAAASQRLDSLRQAVEDYEQASSIIERTESDLEKIARQRQSANERMSEVERLGRKTEAQEAAVAEATRKLADLEKIDESISELRGSVDEMQRSLRPMEEQQGRLESNLAGIRTSMGDAEQAYERALEEAREARLKTELAGAWVDGFQGQTRLAQLESRLKDVESLQEELREVQERLAELVTIDQGGFERLQDLENKSARAFAALEAMATEVEVVAADRAVHIGDAEVSPGRSHTVSERTDVTVGEGVLLRVHPGGGDGLADARAEVRALQEDLRRALDGYGLESTAAAAEMLARRIDLLSRRDSTEAALGQWDPQDLMTRYKETKEKLAAVQAEIKRRSAQLANVEEPPTLVEAEARLEREKTTLQFAETAETNSKATVDALRKQLAEREREFADSREAMEAERRKLTGLVAQLDLLTRSHGSDEARTKALEEARKSQAKLEAELADSLQALETLQPGLLEQDRDRLQRAWEETDRHRQEAKERRAASQATLRSDGTDDPSAALAQAQAWLGSAAAHLETVSRRSRAIALVDDLFQREQRALADLFSQPLAQKINGYLQCLFGPESQVVVLFEDNAFRGVELVRPLQAGSSSFEVLSFGAREQVAAAVRLAVGELLAADHDGSLPVVFDDAFTNSDTERIHMLQRMLDLGASRGLQVIVLTKDPSDYAGLGARQIILQ